MCDRLGARQNWKSIDRLVDGERRKSQKLKEKKASKKTTASCVHIKIAPMISSSVGFCTRAVASVRPHTARTRNGPPRSIAVLWDVACEFHLGIYGPWFGGIRSHRTAHLARLPRTHARIVPRTRAGRDRGSAPSGSGRQPTRRDARRPRGRRRARLKRPWAWRWTDRPVRGGPGVRVRGWPAGSRARLRASGGACGGLPLGMGGRRHERGRPMMMMSVVGLAHPCPQAARTINAHHASAAARTNGMPSTPRKCTCHWARLTDPPAPISTPQQAPPQGPIQPPLVGLDTTTARHRRRSLNSTRASIPLTTMRYVADSIEDVLGMVVDGFGLGLNGFGMPFDRSVHLIDRSVDVKRIVRAH